MTNLNWITVGLLTLSNCVMLYAWYGHLRTHADAPLWIVILSSWAMALVEYSFMIPANRIGAKTMSVAQLRIVQEAVGLLVFIPFSIWIMKQPISWNYAAAAVCILAAVFFVFRG